ncbi:hypothetical protein Glove_267g52 [Diversispora epigaea]|uniref:Peptidase S9A N-terminal domain-containing protein n=1 Tax=Diversispora epigaea TaxID=1348612 RepID=A0A397I5D6_9GLOM|nr:hypothetical protein Glove_267g52 [Diversispora epigaea]
MTTSSNNFLKYPSVRRDETIVENLHGTKVADPYRWLEEPDSEETKEFVEAQNALTFKYLDTYPYRENFQEALTKIYDYEKYETPFKSGNNYYYFYNTGLQAQKYLLLFNNYEEGSFKLFPQPPSKKMFINYFI